MDRDDIVLTKKPSRRELLRVIGVLQGKIGRATAYHANDRDPNGFEKAQVELAKAFDLCIRARSFDPPT
jgi:hypothetical protein